MTPLERFAELRAMRDAASHEARVDAWLEQASRDQSATAVVELFEMALSVLWNRTEFTLGAVTLTAIAERVLQDAKEKHPMLSRAVEIGSEGGIHCGRLREQAAVLDRAALLESIRFVLSELLTVIGTLTAEILTPELHAELSKVGLKGTRS